MKILFVILSLYFSSLSFAMTKEEFLKLDDDSKAEFINTQVTEVDEEKDLQNFQKNNRKLMALILEAADSVSNVWGDTILEGPYSLTGDTETNVYTLYTHNNEVYAVFATVSASHHDGQL